MKIPLPSVVQPLAVKLLGPGRTAHHGNGLLRANPTLETLVVTPSLTCRVGFRGIRSLLLKEDLQVYDIGERFLPVFPHVWVQIDFGCYE